MANPVFKIVLIEYQRKKLELQNALERLGKAVDHRQIERDRVDSLQARIAELEAWMHNNPDV